jgi:hypothetical protein
MVRTVFRNLQCGQRTTFAKNRVNCLFLTGTVDVSLPHEEQNLRRMVWFSVVNVRSLRRHEPGCRRWPKPSDLEPCAGPTRTIHTAGTPHRTRGWTSRFASLTVNSINRPASRHPFLISRAGVLIRSEVEGWIPIATGLDSPLRSEPAAEIILNIRTAFYSFVVLACLA